MLCIGRCRQRRCRALVLGHVMVDHREKPGCSASFACSMCSRSRSHSAPPIHGRNCDGWSRPVVRPATIVSRLSTAEQWLFGSTSAPIGDRKAWLDLRDKSSGFSLPPPLSIGWAAGCPIRCLLNAKRRPEAAHLAL